MFVGRTAERNQLEDIYSSDRNNLVILYGRDGVGKTCFIRQFMEHKRAIYFMARECSEREQLLLFSKELGITEELSQTELGYYELFKAIIRNSKEDGRKPLIIIDEFHFIANTSDSFSLAFAKIMLEKEEFGNIMFLFSSSSITWVEHDMVKRLGLAARCITSFLKLKELTFVDIVKFHSSLSVEDCIYVNAFLGGVPRYLSSWDASKSIADNLKELFFLPNARFYHEAERVLKCGLRELSAYNPILAAMASGKIKLNEIYARTGFSRAKISVYIKNLIAMDLVEKVFSYDTKEKENVQKGLYRIKDHFLNFWYRFVFPYQSEIELGNGAEVFDTIVSKELNTYMRGPFSDVCNEFLKLMNEYHKLPYEYTNWMSWFGKQGLLDMVASDDQGHMLVTNCYWSDEVMTGDHLQMVKELCGYAGIKNAHIFLFSKSGFSPELRELKDRDGNLSLVELKDL